MKRGNPSRLHGALSFMFAQSGEDYRLLFTIGAAAMVLALGIDLIATVTRPRAPEAELELYNAWNARTTRLRGKDRS
jgi:hypothetical protein